MKINEKIKLPLDSNVTLNELQELSKDCKNNEIKIVNWTIINIYYSKLYLTKVVELKYRNKTIMKNYSVLEEFHKFTNETFI